MTFYETEQAPRPVVPVLSICPQCDADLAILRVIPGKLGAEYWTMRCTSCGGIHLDIIKPAPAAVPAE